MNKPLLRLILVSLLTLSPTAVWAGTQAVPRLSGMRGQVKSVGHNSIAIRTKSGVVSLEIMRPLTTYRQVPSTLNQITSSSYIGVASVREPDGTEVAKQIKIFPAQLRGAGEGSFLLGATPGASTHSRMTNGSVSQTLAMRRSRMTNGEAQVQGGGTILKVQYQGGERTIVVPHNVPVTKVAPGKVTLAAGDTVYAVTAKQPNGALGTNTIFVISGPAPMKAS
jgi:hypothetical protein